MKQNKKIIFMVLLLLLSYFIIKYMTFSRPIDKVNNQFKAGIIKSIYDKAKFINSKNSFLEKDSKGHVWWVSKDDYNIFIPADDSLIFRSRTNISENSRNKPIPLILSKSDIKSFYEITIAEFKENNFMKNEKNSSSSPLDDKFYDYVQAYEKGNTKCTITINPEATGTEPNLNDFYYFTTVSCTNNFETEYAKQQPFLKALNIHDAVISEVLKNIGNFYMLSISSRRTGYYSIIEKEGNTYVEIYSGQNVPPCDKLEQSGVPREIYDTCLDPKTQN